MLITLSGLPGVGKSAVATVLAAGLGAVHLSIDPVEDALLGAGCPPTERTGIAAYEAVRAAAELNLALGRTVVVDAVNDSEPARETWRLAARRNAVRSWFFLLVLDDPDEHLRRLTGRSRPYEHFPEPSWAEVQARAAAYAPWAPGEAHTLDARRPVPELVAELRAVLDGAPRMGG